MKNSVSRPTLSLHVFNRQKTRRIDLHFLRQIARDVAPTCFPDGGELGVHLIDSTQMARLNERFLNHAGSTDVITFNYQENPDETRVCGEIYISVDDAVQSAPRFRSTWQSELVRYLVHGVLHLRGYDDLQPAARRVMKREENRLLKDLSRRFDLGRLERVNNSHERK